MSEAWLNLGKKLASKPKREKKEGKEERRLMLVKRKKKKSKKDKKKKGRYSEYEQIEKHQKKIKRMKRKELKMRIQEEKKLALTYDKPFESKPYEKLKGDEGFVFRHKIGLNVLDINIQKFGDPKLREFGLLEHTVPRFKRIHKNMILGLVANRAVGEIVDDLNKITGVRTRFGGERRRVNNCKEDRYYIMYPRLIKGEDWRVEKIYGQKMELEYNSTLDQDIIEFSEDISGVQGQSDEFDRFDFSHTSESEKRYLIKTKELNQRMAHERNNPLFWKELLELQETMTFTNNKLTEKIINEKKIAILEKAFESYLIRNNLYLRLLELSCKMEMKVEGDRYSFLENEHNKLNRFYKGKSGIAFYKEIDFKFNYFLNFSGTYFRDEIGKIIKSKIRELNQSMDSQEIVLLQEKILLLFSKALNVEKRMGYIQKSSGMIVALLQLNFFPEQTVESLKKDWENFKVFKLGENSQSDLKSFIEYESQLKKVLKGEIGFRENVEEFHLVDVKEFCKSEYGKHKSEWRFSNLDLEPYKLEEDSDSIVLIDDIVMFIFEIYEEKIKMQLLSTSLEHFGIYCCDSSNDSIYSLGLRDYTISACLSKDEELARQKLAPSFFLKNQFFTINNFLLNRSKAEYLAKLEFGKRILKRVYQDNPGNKRMMVTLFTVLYLQSTLECNLECEKEYKELLKDNQDQEQLWLTFVNLEYFFRKETKKGLKRTLSTCKTILKFFKDDSKLKLRVKSFILSILLSKNAYFEHLDFWKFIIYIVAQSLTDISIDLKNFSTLHGFCQKYLTSKKSGSETLDEFLSFFVMDFLKIEKILEKLLVNLMMIKASKESSNKLKGGSSSYSHPNYLSQLSCIFITKAALTFLRRRTRTEDELRSDLNFVEKIQEMRNLKLNKITNSFLHDLKSKLYSTEVESLYIFVMNLFLLKKNDDRVDLNCFKKAIVDNQGSFIIAEMTCSALLKEKFSFLLTKNFFETFPKIRPSIALTLISSIMNSKVASKENLIIFFLEKFIEISLDRVVLDFEEVNRTMERDTNLDLGFLKQSLILESESESLISLKEIYCIVGIKKYKTSAKFQALVLQFLHDHPFNKIFYLVYLQLSQDGDSSKRVYGSMLEKEIKLYYDLNFDGV